MVRESERVKIIHAFKAIAIGVTTYRSRKAMIKYVIEVGDDLSKDLELDRPRKAEKENYEKITQTVADLGGNSRPA